MIKFPISYSVQNDEIFSFISISILLIDSNVYLVKNRKNVTEKVTWNIQYIVEFLENI